MLCNVCYLQFFDFSEARARLRLQQIALAREQPASNEATTSFR